MVAGLVAAAGCGSAERQPASRPTAGAAVASAQATAAGPPVGGASASFEWAPVIASPRPAPAESALSHLLQPCGSGDASLHRVADRLAQRQAQGLGQLDMAELTFAMRTAGGPHVWPRAWTLEGDELDPVDTSARFSRFLSSFGDGGVRRCGLSSSKTSLGDSVIAAVVVDALADLSPVPVRARLGQWIDVRADMLVPATAAKVVVLGPRGAPKEVPTSLNGPEVRGRFAVDASGEWTAQVLASVATGPRPVVEATIYVGEEPPGEFGIRPAPGEQAAVGVESDEAAIAAMVDAARRSEGLPALVRDARLDEIAVAHADAMYRARVVGHDVGNGDPRERVDAARIDFRATGENVARARSLERAHRALWASPSHRGNLLLERFEAIGVGVVRDEDGSVWVCEVFADF